MTASARDDRLTWTQLGIAMGYTSEQPQREDIIAAVDRMAWTETPARMPYLDGPTVRAIVAAIFHRRRDHVRLVGVSQLNGGRQLIGLQDSLGTRSYLLDLDDEAVYVLAELQHPLTSHPHVA